MPELEMTLQCVISAANNDDFEFQPYEGQIEANCDEAFAKHRKLFYSEIHKTLMSLDKLSKSQIDCAIKGFKIENFEVYAMIMKLGLDLTRRGKFDAKWTSALSDVTQNMVNIYKRVDAHCNFETIISDSPPFLHTTISTKAFVTEKSF